MNRGTLYVEKAPNGLLMMDFPQAVAKQVDMDEDVISQFGACINLSVSKIRGCYFEPRSGKLMVVVDDIATVSAVIVNSQGLMGIDFGRVVKGVNISAMYTEDSYDITTRYFAPWVGIEEDPVNGWSHTILAPLYASITGKTELRSFMCSSRGGDVVTELFDNGRVVLSGYAKTSLCGTLFT
eukprot:TRINITY_DN8483_c0_g1_i2.p2 TRINITY_DN8483_c0_g1~~TRINITY_DN8483_c0_g1_i2.p2  ORF type:complete len:182 (+),score=37.57 TRINITY_DN8483_c0_g1_i2:249-794(+)